MDFTIFTLILLGVVFVYFFAGIRIVPQAEQQVVERLGRYHRTLSGGLNFIIPVVDRVRAKFNTQEQVIDIPVQKVITKDNVSITIDGLVFMRVGIARKATYEILDLKHAIAQLAQTTLRSEIGKMDLDDTLSSRDTLNATLLMALDAASANWGAKVTRVEISDISVPEAVQHAMELQLRAERERRATETEAEGLKNATIAKAEGDRQKAFKEAEAIERTADARRYEQIQLAQGQQQAIEMIALAMQSNPSAAEFLLAKDRIKAWEGIAASDSQNKIVIPYEASELIGSLSALQSLLTQTGATK
ncbi:paraslipin [Thiomicrospira microaerophila]|uniref:SPFH domain-containing protein n=1 Tax=Thiomicrospira microaerophila TaxID=406020 RepID=UPI00200DF807|nr:stomatin-like protein [Thiomicrospira microaerophila]UQB42746.1 paraslipin [Thiomicrospira microaerophila]